MAPSVPSVDCNFPRICKCGLALRVPSNIMVLTCETHRRPWPHRLRCIALLFVSHSRSVMLSCCPDICSPLLVLPFLLSLTLYLYRFLSMRLSGSSLVDICPSRELCFSLSLSLSPCLYLSLSFSISLYISVSLSFYPSPLYVCLLLSLLLAFS